MTDEQAANWRDLCNAALTARDPERLLEIIQKLNATLEREEKLRARLRKHQGLSIVHDERHGEADCDVGDQTFLEEFDS